MSDDDKPDNVVEPNFPKHDRVMALADELCKALSRSYAVNKPEEHLAALYLAEAAVQHICVSKYGIEGYNNILRRANDIRRGYGFHLVPEKTIYDENEQPKDAPVVPLFKPQKDEDHE